VLRLAFFPIVLIVIAIVLAVLAFYIIRKLRRGVKITFKKGADIANEQQQKWQQNRDQKEHRKKQPEIVQKGFRDFDEIEKAAKKLPSKWKLLTSPLIEDCQVILDDLTADQDTISESKVNSIRTFFNHTLDALYQFIEKINTDHQQMTIDEIEKAQENISIIKADLLYHKKIIHKKRKLDFDVLMDVIKARLKR
jgi:phosphoribosyl-ATP pyrophosphohydrolase